MDLNTAFLFVCRPGERVEGTPALGVSCSLLFNCNFHTDQEAEQMEKRIIRQETIAEFGKELARAEKSRATREKYVRDVRAFHGFAEGRPVTKERVREWKEALVEKGYAVRSVNSMLASLNSFLAFMGWEDCSVKNLRIQRQTYCGEEQELTKEEYLRLLDAAEGDERLRMLLETICGTGIRVSELQFFTVEAARRGQIDIRNKGKTRMILIPDRLRKKLLAYAKKRKIKNGVLFRTRSGKPLDRSNIWSQMKRLCQAAGVSSGKVFPHNLRKLFARLFYGVAKDIAKLADVLGHSSINTTRIYIMTTGSEHRRQLDMLGVVV